METKTVIPDDEQETHKPSPNTLLLLEEKGLVARGSHSKGFFAFGANWTETQMDRLVRVLFKDAFIYLDSLPNNQKGKHVRPLWRLLTKERKNTNLVVGVCAEASGQMFHELRTGKGRSAAEYCDLQDLSTPFRTRCTQMAGMPRCKSRMSRRIPLRNHQFRLG